MTVTNLAPAIGVQLTAELRGKVRVNDVGDRVVLVFGDDPGLFLMGDPAVVHELVVEADRQLTLLLRNGRQG